MNWQQIRRYASPAVVLAALGIGAALVLGLLLWFFWFRPLPAAPSEERPAVLTLIPGPSSTPAPSLTPRPTSTATATFAALQAGELGVGAYVQIIGTEGTGLNIRNAPGLASEVQFLGYDAEVFEVRDGPREVDGFVWWYLVTPVDENRAGWAAADYLEVVANP